MITVEVAPLVSSIEVDRPPEVVFPYVIDPAQFPARQPAVVASEMDGEVCVGAVCTTTRKISEMPQNMDRLKSALEALYAVTDGRLYGWPTPSAHTRPWTRSAISSLRNPGRRCEVPRAPAQRINGVVGCRCSQTSGAAAASDR